MADKQTVKVGDKVRSKYSCHSGGYDIGDVFTVTKVDGEFIEFVDKDGSDRLRSSDEFDLLPVADTTSKPAFKVGDRVRLTAGEDEYRHSGSIGLIVRLEKSYARVLFDAPFDGWGETGRNWHVQLSNLELADLTIETGKFYRTRDGRKVGPMRRYSGGWLYETDDHGRMWRDDGMRYYEESRGGGSDLIAEWVDEPASNDNAEPQKASAPCALRNVTISFDPAPTQPAIVALIENGQPKPSEQPKVHQSEQSATDEAERLAVKYPGQKFGVFVLADSRIADVVIRRAA